MPTILWKSFLWVCITCAVIVAASATGIALYETGSSTFNEWRTAWKMPRTVDPAVVGTWSSTPEVRGRAQIYKFESNGAGTLEFPDGGSLPFAWGAADGKITIRFQGRHGALAPTYPYRISGKSMTFIGAKQFSGRFLRDYTRVPG